MLLTSRVSGGIPNEPARLLIVANRLPITIKQNEHGEYAFMPSSGGLATGLRGLSQITQFQWFGWPGIEVPRREIKRIEDTLRQEFSAVPIWLSQKLSDYHYNGFSNSVLWPALHDFRERMHTDLSSGVAYEAVNRLFAKELASHVRDNDVVWIHDYHLMLLPQYLREEIGDARTGFRIGFFLHTPFPGLDMWKDVPMSADILRGLMGADLVGFHTKQYAENFKNCCNEILFLDVDDFGINLRNTVESRLVEVEAFPIGISPDDLINGCLEHDKQFETHVEYMKRQFKNYHVIVGVDRMDYTKGIPEKLKAFEYFLRRYPKWKGKVLLVQIGIPSRESLAETKRVISDVYSLVGEINGIHGSIDYTPVRFLHQSVPKGDLAALYAASDVCLVSAIRDGMNLVSYEYVACQRARHGVLIIGKNIGAASMLEGALLIDPKETEDVARAIDKALEMGKEERKARQEKNLETVIKHTSAVWGQNFVQRLKQTEAKEAWDSISAR